MSLRWPITSEREIRAGPISDVPQICNNSCASVVDGRQPFLPVGFPAVSSGFQGGWDCSQSGAVAAGSSRLACRAAWERAALEVRAARITAGLPGLFPGLVLALAPDIPERFGHVLGPPERRAAGAGCFQQRLFTFSPCMHVGHGYALPCGNNPTLVESPSRWERS